VTFILILRLKFNHLTSLLSSQYCSIPRFSNGIEGKLDALRAPEGQEPSQNGFLVLENALRFSISLLSLPVSPKLEVDRRRAERSNEKQEPRRRLRIQLRCRGESTSKCQVPLAKAITLAIVGFLSMFLAYLPLRSFIRRCNVGKKDLST
jgi:hypothetical protein